TKYGITPADMPGVAIKDLTVEQAIAYYTEHYWKSLYSQISSQLIANKLFDMGVLFGIGEAVKCLQRALDVNADGIFGPQTLAMTNAVSPTLLLDEFQTQLCLLVPEIIAAHPVEAEDAAGWKRRINGN